MLACPVWLWGGPQWTPVDGSQRPMRQEDVIAGQEGRIVDPTKAVPLGPQVSATVEINQGRVDSMSDVENNQSPVKPGLIQK